MTLNVSVSMWCCGCHTVVSCKLLGQRQRTHVLWAWSLSAEQHMTDWVVTVREKLSVPSLSHGVGKVATAAASGIILHQSTDRNSAGQDSQTSSYYLVTQGSSPWRWNVVIPHVTACITRFRDVTSVFVILALSTGASSPVIGKIGQTVR